MSESKNVVDGKVNFNLGSSLFWILMILIALVGLAFIGVWSFHNDSIRGLGIAFIFTIMIIVGLLLSRFEIFDSGNWSQNSLLFTVGFAFWAFIGSTGKSILSISKNNLFANIASQLPIPLEFASNTFIIPLAEELFFIIGIPFTLLSVFKILGKKFSMFKNEFLQMALIIIIDSLLFALFHVGKMYISFLISALIFRGILVTLVIGDVRFNWFRGVAFTSAFALGAHVGNNWGSFGLLKGVSIILSNTTLMIVLIPLFLAIVIGAINKIGLGLEKLFTGKGVSE